MHSIDFGASSSNWEAQQGGTIFVCGLSLETTEEDFTGYFTQYGPLKEYELIRYDITDEPTGYGSVTFQYPFVVDTVLQDSPHFINDRLIQIIRVLPSEADASNDLVLPREADASNDLVLQREADALNDQWIRAILNEVDFSDMGNRIEFDGAQAEAELVEPRGAVSNPCTLYVGGFPLDVIEEEFSDFFKQYGEVKEAKIIRDRDTSMSRGFGFITFDSEEVVDNLLATRRRIEFAGVKVKIGKAERKMPQSSEPSNVSGSSSYGGGQGNAYDRYGRRAGAMGHPYTQPSIGRSGHYGGYGGYHGASRVGSSGHGAHRSVSDGGRGGARGGASRNPVNRDRSYGGSRYHTYGRR